MSDRLVLLLNDDWAIFADRQQWILSKSRTRGVGQDWMPVAFIGSTKSKLLSTTFDKDVVISAEAEAVLAKWPERFLDWRLTVAN